MEKSVCARCHQPILYLLLGWVHKDPQPKEGYHLPDPKEEAILDVTSEWPEREET